MVDKRRKKQQFLPLYAVFPLLSCVAVNSLVYFGTEALTGNWKHYDLTLPIDRAIPLVPGFTVIYLGCYIFWIINYILIARQGEEHCFRFVTADMLSRIVSGIIFILLPTTNVRPVLPSIHCLVSWFCYIGIRGRANIPKAYRGFSCIFALLVCVSTQLTKQHYIIDAFGGIAIAELTYWLAFHTQAYRGPKRVFDWLYRGIFDRQGKISRKEGEA